MIVKQLPEPRERAQCELPKDELNPATIGWKGYRETRTKVNGHNPNQCMRVAAWEVDGQKLCAQHAGLKVLHHLKEKE